MNDGWTLGLVPLLESPGHFIPSHSPLSLPSHAPGRQRCCWRESTRCRGSSGSLGQPPPRRASAAPGCRGVAQCSRCKTTEHALTILTGTGPAPMLSSPAISLATGRSSLPVSAGPNRAAAHVLRNKPISRPIVDGHVHIHGHGRRRPYAPPGRLRLLHLVRRPEQSVIDGRLIPAELRERGLGCGHPARGPARASLAPSPAALAPRPSSPLPISATRR